MKAYFKDLKCFFESVQHKPRWAALRRGLWAEWGFSPFTADSGAALPKVRLWQTDGKSFLDVLGQVTLELNFLECKRLDECAVAWLVPLNANHIVGMADSNTNPVSVSGVTTGSECFSNQYFFFDVNHGRNYIQG
jgi:hypothetical protein